MSTTFYVEAQSIQQFDAIQSEGGAPELNVGATNAIRVLRDLGLHDLADAAITDGPWGILDPDTILAVPAEAVYRGDELHAVARAARALRLRVGYC